MTSMPRGCDSPSGCQSTLEHSLGYC